MKVKTKFGVLLASMTLCGAALVGCGGDNPPAPPATSYHVVCTKDDAKYTVNGLAETYAAGATVAFTITEKDPTNYKVTGVTSTQVTVTTVSALSYSFTMPETDVSLTVGTKEVDKYSVTPSTEDIVVNEPVTFLLKLGETEVVNITISKGASETKSLEISDNEVTFKEKGEFVLAFKDNDRNKVAGEFSFTVRERAHGETEDDPLTAAEAIAIAHELDITWNEKVDGKTVWHYGGVSEVKYYIEDVVTFVKEQTPEDIDQFKNRTFNFGEFQAFQIQWKSKDGWEVIKDIQVGSTVKIYSKLMNFGGKDTEKAKGTPETYKLAPEYPAIVKVDNETLQSITLNHSTLSMIPGDKETLVATLVPSAGQNILWDSSNPAVATVAGGLVEALAIGETTITASVGDKTAECKVSVSTTKKILRPLTASEISTAENMLLGYEDGGVYHFSNGDPVSEKVYYMNTTTAEGEAAKASVTVKEGKYAIKFGDYYVGYEWAKGSDSNFHHNLRTPSSVDDPLVAWFTLDEASLSFSLTGGDDAHTTIYLVKHNSNSAIRLSDQTNTAPVRLLGLAEPAPVTSVSMDDVAVMAENTVTLEVLITPFYATVKTIVFSTEDTEHITLNAETGVVTGKAAGTATVTVTVNDTVTDSCTVTVSAKPSGVVTAKLDGNTYADANGITTNGDKIKSGTIEIDEVASFTVGGFSADKGNTGKMYKGKTTNKWAIRLYKSENATITVNVKEGYTLVSVIVNVRVQQGSESSDLYNLGTDVEVSISENKAVYSVTEANTALYYVTVQYAPVSA